MTVVIRRSKPQGCDVCGAVKELRPYGPNGEWICFDCGMKDEKATKAAFAKRLEANNDPLPPELHGTQEGGKTL